MVGYVEHRGGEILRSQQINEFRQNLVGVDDRVVVGVDDRLLRTILNVVLGALGGKDLEGSRGPLVIRGATQSGSLTTSCMQAARVENTIPSSYRLVRLKETGELVLQGCFQWTEGWKCGSEWQTIPTIEEE